MAPPPHLKYLKSVGNNLPLDNATLHLFTELMANNTTPSNITLEDLATPTSDQQAFDNLDPLSLVIPLSIIYALIFIVGVLGNVSTCIVISKNKSMATATNYYLFSLAVSDMLLLVTGLPPEMYQLWSPEKYVFGQAFCIIRSVAAEMSANASILTITAFTVERYLAICHPFLSHTMSKLSRVIKFILAIWVISLCLAIPQGIQFGIEYQTKDGVESSICTVVNKFFPHAFEISTFVFFVAPMTLISVLYVFIGIQLRRRKNVGAQRPSVANANSNESRRKFLRHTAAQNRVVKMLVAVVAAFFICWAPFHAQRLMAVYLTDASSAAQQQFLGFYTALTYTSGVLYYLSTCVNPVLYHIMSNKFRKEFKKTFTELCHMRKTSRDSSQRRYSTITKTGRTSRRHTQRSFSDDEDNIPMQTTVTRLSRKSDDFLGNPPIKPATTAINQTPPISNSDKLYYSSNNNDNDSATNPAALKELNDQRRLLYRKFSRRSSFTINRKSAAATSSNNFTKKSFDFFPFNLWKVLTQYRRAAVVVVHRTNDDDSVSENEAAPNGSASSGRVLKQHRKRHSVQSEDSEISDSSLQDMDDTEYSSNDLAKYIQEVNDNL